MLRGDKVFDQAMKGICLKVSSQALMEIATTTTNTLAEASTEIVTTSSAEAKTAATTGTAGTAITRTTTPVTAQAKVLSFRAELVSIRRKATANAGAFSMKKNKM